MDGFHRAIVCGRKVETQATMIYNRMSRYLAEARSELIRAKRVYKVAYQALFADPEAKEFSVKDRERYAKDHLTEEENKLDDSQNDVQQLTLYLGCVDRVIQTVKHYREDVGRRLKVIDIQHEIGEVN